jgi:hypothetical protein
VGELPTASFALVRAIVQLLPRGENMRVFSFLLVVGIATCAFAQSGPARPTIVTSILLSPLTAPIAADASLPKIDATAVWTLTPQFNTTAHNNCDKTARSGFAECFINQMSKAGAGNAAVAFTRQLYKESHGEVGIMTGFQSAQPVDIAWITYPLRANTNYGLLLVNGHPQIVNVEDLKLLDQKGMKQSPQFQDLKNQFPQVDVWPGDRDGTTWPNSQSGPNGSTQYLIDYPLINGCHACARAGRAIFTWNFDAAGKFLGTTFQGMTPAPLQ